MNRTVEVGISDRQAEQPHYFPESKMDSSFVVLPEDLFPNGGLGDCQQFHNCLIFENDRRRN